jgi:hypothetical protein
MSKRLNYRVLAIIFLMEILGDHRDGTEIVVEKSQRTVNVLLIMQSVFF